MAAISKVVCGILAGSGSEIIAHKMVYGCTYSLFKNWYPRYKIKVTWVDFNDLNALNRAITPQTRMLYFETPVNPTMELIDIQKVVEIAKQHNVHRSQLIVFLPSSITHLRLHFVSARFRSALILS